MLHIIANTTAGNGRAQDILRRVEARLGKKQVPYQTHISEYAGHSIEIARSLSGGEEPVVALGGDGTVAEVAQGLVHSATPMGIIPAGSGNDYRRCHGIPGDPIRALERVLEGKAQPVDTMDMNGRVFLNIINVGFDNEVAAVASKYKGFGKLSYLIAVFDVLRYYQNKTMRVHFDDQVVEQKMLLMCAGCGTHYGGGMHALPTADPCDGLLDLCIVDDVSPATVARILPLFMMGKHHRISCAHLYRAREISIECTDEIIPVGGDGELVPNATPARLKVCPASLQLIV